MRRLPQTRYVSCRAWTLPVRNFALAVHALDTDTALRALLILVSHAARLWQSFQQMQRTEAAISAAGRWQPYLQAAAQALLQGTDVLLARKSLSINGVSRPFWAALLQGLAEMVCHVPGGPHAPAVWSAELSAIKLSPAHGIVVIAVPSAPEDMRLYASSLAAECMCRGGSQAPGSHPDTCQRSPGQAVDGAAGAAPTCAAGHAQLAGSAPPAGKVLMRLNSVCLPSIHAVLD